MQQTLPSLDQYIAEVFPEPPLSIQKAKQIKRTLKGMKKCNKPCQVCPFILEGKEIKGDKFDWKITTPANFRPICC